MLLNEDMRACARACADCADVCTETIAHCLDAGGNHVGPYHVRLLSDCVSICRASADFLRRGSDFHAALCDVVAGLCRRCAVDCRVFGEDEMDACAAACERCASSCERLARAPAADEARRADSRATGHVPPIL